MDNVKKIKLLQENDYIDDTPDDGIDKMVIGVRYPPLLKRKMSENDESVINLLQIASISWNNQLTKNPALGFGHIVFFLKSEKIEHDFRVHSVYFSPTLDLENTEMTALISSTNNGELKKYMDDGVLSFYVSGKIVQKKNGDVESIVINKLSTKVDQTAYARRYQKQTLPSPPAFPETTVVVENFPKKPIEIEKSVSDKWKEFADTKKQWEEEKSSSLFNDWKKLAKKKVNDAWNKIKG